MIKTKLIGKIYLSERHMESVKIFDGTKFVKLITVHVPSPWQNTNGILAMLDEECLRPGNVSDATFLTKLGVRFNNHNHFKSKATQNEKRITDSSLAVNAFRIEHYAGEVRINLTHTVICSL